MQIKYFKADWKQYFFRINGFYNRHKNPHFFQDKWVTDLKRLKVESVNSRSPTTHRCRMMNTDWEELSLDSSWRDVIRRDQCVCVQVKSVKPCLKQLQQCIQTISTLHDDEILPSNSADLFHWLPKEHMCVLVYLVSDPSPLTSSLGWMFFFIVSVRTEFRLFSLI